MLDKYGKGLVYGEFRERLNYLPDIAVGENAARTATFVSVVVRTFSKSWGQGAACRNEDPELFFPLTNSGRLNAAAVQQANEAKAICKNCPVKLPCLKTALDQDEAEAIRGGIWFKFKSQELPAAMIQLVHRMVRIR